MRYAPIFLVLLAGCAVPSREDVEKDVQARLESTKQEAVKSASQMAQRAWDSAQREASKLTAESSEKALLEAKKSLVKVQNELANAKIPGPEGNGQRRLVDEQISRLNAALDLKNVQSQLDQAVEKAKALPVNAQKTDAEIRAKLAAADREYRKLQAEYQRAQDGLKSAERTLTEIQQKMGLNGN